MKAIFEDIPSKKGISSFYSAYLKVPFFEFKWHYHPEYELTFIIKGNGFRIVGNSQEPFTAGDLVLLGSNLPHTWWGKPEELLNSEAIVIQFSHEFISPFLTLNEGHLIHELISQASRGLKFTVDESISKAIFDIIETEGLERVLKLISILNLLSIQESKQLATRSFQNVISKKFETRINKVCTFIQNHYAEPISLRDVADIVYMSESNFCKFFKKATNSTFSEYLNEQRINEACRLLISTDELISKISQDCGFESLSYFNRVFLRKKQMTPTVFRNQCILLNH